MPPQLHLSYDQSVACIAPRFSVSALDIPVTAQETDANWTDVVSATRKSNTGKYLLRFQVSGQQNPTTDITAMCRVTVDGAIANFAGGYGNRISTVIANRAVVARGLLFITGLSAKANHTFVLQAAFRTTTYTIHSASNPGLERGYLIVQPF